MSTGTRLAIGAAVIVSMTGYMAYLGASGSWRYYLTVDECAADTPTFLNRSLRVNGRVASDSLQIDRDRASAAFVLKGRESELHVLCTGPIPDNLAEDMDVVVEGRLESADQFRGDKVLTRCASKYEPKDPRSTSAASVVGREAKP